MPVIGTAGHVDHGKSTLVQALTGRDPDRWAEEKERGVTIDLGFAWTTLDDGTEVSFVDVPGHERFVKNMLAGIEAVDVAILVVAADEGWMPQTEEHLAVLDLLDVRHGVVALTKVDRVDRDLVDLATLEIEERLEGTTLEGSTTVPVSAPSGVGIDELRAELSRLIGLVQPEPGGRPRMWIDRVFSVSGAGTVVTGTLLGGQVAVEDSLWLWPGASSVRVRSIQTHEKKVETVDPRRRVALNLAGVDRTDIARGAMVGIGEQWEPTDTIAVSIRPARYVEELTDRGAYHLHLGSGAWPVRLRMIGAGAAIVDLSEPLCLTMGDRFILRETGRRMVVGGGQVLEPAGGRPARLRPSIAALGEAVAQGDPDAMASALLGARGRDRSDRLRRHSAGGVPHDGVSIGSDIFTPETAEELAARITTLVTSFHETHPLRPGIPTAEAAERVGLTPDALEDLVGLVGDVVLDGTHLRVTQFVVGLTEDQEGAWAKAQAMLATAGPTEAPRVDELGLDPDLHAALVRDGKLIRVSGEFSYLPEHVDALVATMRGFAEPFTVSEFKDRAGISRKYAVPVLEWADGAGITVRMGDRRRLRG